METQLASVDNDINSNVDRFQTIGSAEESTSVAFRSLGRSLIEQRQIMTLVWSLFCGERQERIRQWKTYAERFVMSLYLQLSLSLFQSCPCSPVFSPSINLLFRNACQVAMVR